MVQNESIGKTNIDKQQKHIQFKLGDIVKMRNGGTDLYAVVEVLDNDRYVLDVLEVRQTWKVPGNWIEMAD